MGPVSPSESSSVIEVGIVIPGQTPYYAKCSRHLRKKRKA